jgi:hypothetical protein
MSATGSGHLLGRSLAAWLLLIPGLACAGQAGALPDLEGTRSVYAETAEGDRLRLGGIEFKADGEGYRFELDIDESAFVDNFLSMTPFNCLDGPQTTFCHMVYPYPSRRYITADDTVDLTYALLFFYKNQAEYHAAFFNGLYYRMRPEGNGLVGEPLEVDLNLLVVPPPEGELRPIKPADLTSIDPDTHWLRRLVID